MARLIIDNITTDSFDWWITDLQYDFNKTYYHSVGITDVYFEDGGTELPGGVWSSYNAPTYTVEDISGGADGTPGESYLVYGYAATEDDDGNIYYWHIQEDSPQTVTLLSVDKLLTISRITETTAHWMIENLSHGFNTSHYLNAGITTEDFADGTRYLDENQILSLVEPTDEDSPANWVDGTLTRLTPDTTYTVYGFAKTLDKKFYKAGEYTFKTREPRPVLPSVSNFTVVQKANSKKTAICSWNTVDWEYATSYSIAVDTEFLEYYPDTQDYVETKIVKTGTALEYNEVEIEFPDYGLYYVLVIVHREGFGWYTVNAQITIEEIAYGPLWSWEDTEDRRIALYALENKGNIEDFKYQVWNELVDKVMDTINIDSVNGIEWYTSTDGGNTTHLSYYDTKMTESDRNITAARFNALKFNIGSREGACYIDPDTQITMSGTGIPDVSKGDIIYGWYFIRLTESLNNWIKSLE